MRRLAVAGAGLARLSLYHAWEELQASRLRVVLEAFNPGDLEPIHAVYLGRPDQLPPRTRAVLDFLQAHVDLRHAEALPAGWQHGP
jgi:DNA-binding transcriptional LysR family regulator